MVPHMGFVVLNLVSGVRGFCFAVHDDNEEAIGRGVFFILLVKFIYVSTQTNGYDNVILSIVIYIVSPSRDNRLDYIAYNYVLTITMRNRGDIY